MPESYEPTRRSLLFAVAGIPVIKDRNFRGKIEASNVAALMASENLTRDGLMMKLLPVAKGLAHPPLSSYFVGAVVLGASGSLYLGANIEIPGNMLGLAVHAEQAAIANAYMAGEKGVEAIAVTAAPCGHCRQFLSEMSVDTSLRVLVAGEQPITLTELLPRAFGPKDLGFTQGALPVRRSPTPHAINTNDVLVQQALAALNSSYSPYTKSPSGVAIATSNNLVFPGSYIENAAFNPSLPPLEAALAGYFAAGANAGGIQRVVLVEGINNAISHRSTAKSVLSVLAPAAKFDFVTASKATL